MSILIWAMVGLAAGLLAGIVSARYGLLEDAIVGTVGSIAGGWLYAELARTPITEFNPLTLLGATLGAALFLLLARGFTRGRAAI